MPISILHVDHIKTMFAELSQPYAPAIHGSSNMLVKTLFTPRFVIMYTKTIKQTTWGRIFDHGPPLVASNCVHPHIHKFNPCPIMKSFL